MLNPLNRKNDALTAAEHRAKAAMHKAAFAAEMGTFFRTGVVVCAALAVVVIATAAWFANNDQVVAANPSTTAAVSSNLIIAHTPEEMAARTLDNEPFSITFTEDGMYLTPARHHDGADYPVLLEYNTNPREVSAEHGLQAGSEALTFAPVPVYDPEIPRVYYYDYQVYIAAYGEAFDAASLTASMELTATNPPAKDYLNAVTLDFYRGTEYKGTLNAVGLDWQNTGTPVTTVELAPAEGLHIPLHTEDAKTYIPVTMRIYFDGGLLKTDGQTFVYSNGLDTGEYTLKVSFTAVDKAA